MSILENMQQQINELLKINLQQSIQIEQLQNDVKYLSSIVTSTYSVLQAAKAKADDNSIIIDRIEDNLQNVNDEIQPLSGQIQQLSDEVSNIQIYALPTDYDRGF